MFVVIVMIVRIKRDGKRGFLDLGKSYDRVNWNILCEVLAKIGMKEQIVNIIRSMYGSTPAV